MILADVGESALLGLAGGLAAAVPVAVAGWVWPGVAAVAVWVAAGLAVGGVATGAVAALLRRPTLLRAAAFADRRTGSGCPLATAVELASSAGSGSGPANPFAEAVFAEAAEAWRTRGVHLSFRTRGAWPARLAAAAGAVLLPALLVPAGLLTGRAPVPPLSADADALDPHIRNLNEAAGGGGGDGGDDVDSVRRFVAALKAGKARLQDAASAGGDPDAPRREMRALSAEAREALARLASESLSPDQRRLLEELLGRAARDLTRRAGEDPGERPASASPADTSSAAKSDPAAPAKRDATTGVAARTGSGTSDAGAQAVSAGSGGTDGKDGRSGTSGGATGTGASSPAGLSAGEFAELWRRAAGSAPSDGPDAPPEYRDLLRAYFRPERGP
jgi:hypothetical protein